MEITRIYKLNTINFISLISELMLNEYEIKKNKTFEYICKMNNHQISENDIILRRHNTKNTINMKWLSSNTSYIRITHKSICI